MPRPILLIRGLALASVLLAAAPRPAHAQSSDFSVRVGAALATFTSSDQLGYLRYDQQGVLGSLQLGYSLVPWFDAYLGATGGGFLSSERATGGLLAPMTGVRAHLTNVSVTPYAQLDLGAAFTGTLARPFMEIAIGADFPLGSELALGPSIGYGRVFQPGGLGNSSDAAYLSFGLVASFRAHTARRAPAPLRAPLSPPTVYVHDSALREPPTPEPSPELLELIDRAMPQEESARIELLAPVLFAFDSDTLEPIGVAMLHEVAHLLHERDDLELVEIQGYADKRGDAEYNRQLAGRRAERVKAWLVEHGVAAERLVVAALGARDLVEAGDEEAEHEQNRRVVFRVLRSRPKTAKPKPAAEPAAEPTSEPEGDGQ